MPKDDYSSALHKALHSHVSSLSADAGALMDCEAYEQAFDVLDGMQLNIIASFSGSIWRMYSLRVVQIWMAMGHVAFVMPDYMRARAIYGEAYALANRQFAPTQSILQAIERCDVEINKASKPAPAVVVQETPSGLGSGSAFFQPESPVSADEKDHTKETVFGGLLEWVLDGLRLTSIDDSLARSDRSSSRQASC